MIWGGVAGAEPVILTGTRDARLEIGRALGADHVVNVTREKPVEAATLQKLGSLYFTRPTLVNYNATREELTALAGAMFDLVRTGALKAAIGQQYPLAEAARAHTDPEQGRTSGASILLP